MSKMDEKRIYWSLVVCIVVLCADSIIADLPECGVAEYHYEYTQCDAHGHRWRVSVPEQDKCKPTAAHYTNNLPVKGTDCNMECSSGQYLDMISQTCHNCEPGTFSSGSTARFDDWDTLPTGFSITTESFQGYGDEMEANCTGFDWSPKGSYIAATPGGCAAKLIYSVTLVKAGSLSFEYQLPTSNSLFHVTVQNDQCQSSNDKDASKWPDTTDDGEWKSIAMKLKTGFNVITWRVIGVGMEGSQPQPILVKKVHVRGVAFSSNCAKCGAGTYSSEGAKYCTECPINTYSGKGASSCISCDLATQYSDIGSTNCSVRPKCTSSDYYHLLKPCEQGKTGTTFQWIQPMICNKDLPDSIKLPNDTDLVDCHPCNPGMHLNENQTCAYCPADYMSDGTQCKKCEASTAPDYGYVFENWNSIPEDIQTTCVSFSDDKCNTDTKWLPFGDHLESHFARGESAYLVMQLTVDGFRMSQNEGEAGSVTIGQVSIAFETVCGTSSFCQLVLLSDESGKEDVITLWENTQPLTKYVHDVKNNGTFTFTLAFQNSGWLLGATELRNVSAKIYSIQVSNTLGGGASQCRKCPKGFDQDGCIPCPDGHYIDPVMTTCVKCPPGTIVESHNAYGAESCKPCGEGLQVHNGKLCFSNGMFKANSGKTFDMRNLSSYQFVHGSQLFTSSGTKYFHGFNISMFGSPDRSQVVCQNNVTRTDSSAMREPKQVSAMICRSTMVPSQDDSGEIMSTQSTSLGEHLVKIVYNETCLDVKNGTESSIRNLYKASGFDVKDLENDIQVHFADETPTRSCPKGRTAVVSLRCDIDEKGNVINLPPKCADGTCDGCTFHFMWSTRLACPICEKEEFKRLVGECVSGSQTIHYFPPKHCIVKEEIQTEKRTCTMQLTALPLAFQVAIPVVVGLAVILMFLLCFFWRKNKKLEYRYMKLVEGSGGNDEELPAADSCGLEEGEDEMGDSVQIRDSKGARFFKKLSNKIKKSDDAFDSALMNERMPLT